jgi:hypothetical protein
LEAVWLSLAILLVMVGVIGTFIPVLPGIGLIFAGFLVWGLASGWSDYGIGTVVVLGLITVIFVALDYYAGAVGAKKFGASGAGIFGAFAGAIIGIFTFNIFGLIVGTFAGAVAGELLSGKSQKDALRAGWGTFLGFLAGSVLKITAAIAMAGLFFYYVIF